ncbi:MAG: hypothetical protein ACXWQE_13020 [Bdellovibrionales bacterium]
MQTQRNERIILYWAVGLFAISCVLPALMCEETEAYKSLSGFWLLLFGWMGVGQAMFAWFANPLGALGAVFLILGKYRNSVIVELLAVVLGLQTFFLSHVPGGEADGSGITYIAHPGAGFYCWELSFILVALYSYRKMASSRSKV